MRITNSAMLSPTDIPFDKAPPYRTKVVEYSTPTTGEQHKQLIKDSNRSTCNLPAE